MADDDDSIMINTYTSMLVLRLLLLLLLVWRRWFSVKFTGVCLSSISAIMIVICP